MKEKPKILAWCLLLVISISFFVSAVSASDDVTLTKDNFVHTSYSDDLSYGVGSTSDNFIYFIEHGKNTILWTHNIGRYVGSIAISPDGNTVAVGCDGGLIYLFDREGNILWNKSFGNAAIRSISFSKDGDFIDASTTLNQAYYISRSGNQVDRPAIPVSTRIVTVIPTITLSSTSDNGSYIWNIISAGNSFALFLIIILMCLFIWAISTNLQKKRSYKNKFHVVNNAIRNTWKKIKTQINLENFTIISLILIGIGFLPYLSILENYRSILLDFFIIGFLCFLLSYYIYAIKCWGADHQACAVLMLMIPLFAYFFATSKIQDSSSNILISLFILLCVYAFISVILLIFGDKVKIEIESLFFKRSQHPHWYFLPKLSYTVVGVVVVSFLVINLGSGAIFSDNVNEITQASQKTSTQSTTDPYQITSSTPHASSSTPIQTYQSTPIPTTIVANYRQSPKTTTYSYVTQGSRGSISFTTYGGLADHFSKEDHSYYNDFEKETIMELLKNDDQDEYLQLLIEAIKKKSSNPDDQAKIAISLVQHIPYNWDGLYSSSSDWYFPYETLHNSKGVCADKSLLLAYLLNELGYDTVLFEFSKHMAVGVKSTSSYDFYDSGYAFVESTRPVIITYIPDTYYGGFTITSNPRIIHLNGGTSSLDVSTEYRDAVRMKQLESMGQVLDQTSYYEWSRITNYYDLQYDT